VSEGGREGGYSPEGCDNPENFIAFSMQLYLLSYSIKPQNETEMSNGTSRNASAYLMNPFIKSTNP
jgi:hypothetical protein